jgi:predicted Zn-dependent protease
MNNNKLFRIEFDSNLKKIRKLMPKLLEIVESGFDEKTYGFIYFSQNISRSVTIHKIESAATSLDRGIVMRLVHLGRNFETATNMLDETGLVNAANALNMLASKEKKQDDGYPFFIPRQWKDENRDTLEPDIVSQIPRNADVSTEVHFSPFVSANPLEMDMAKIKDRAKELRSSIIARDLDYCKTRGIEPLANVYVTLGVQFGTHIFTDRAKNMSQNLPIITGMVMSQTTKGKIGRTMVGGLGGFETLNFSERDFFKTVELPHILDNALCLEPGTYPVITGPTVTGVFAHEAFGHTMESDTVRQGRSIYSLFAGKKVGNDNATIINNPGIFSMADKPYGPNGSYYFDHEGELSREQVILDHGLLGQPMTDLLSSLHLKITRSANGKRESWRRPTLSRQTNTYFSPGDKTLDELISLVRGRGFLTTEHHGGMEDPKGAHLTAGADYFEEIVDGKITGRYFIGPKGGHIELTGYVPDLLSGIVAKTKLDYAPGVHPISRHSLNKSGGCGKYHKELVKAGSGGPYIFWSAVTCG